MAEAFARAYGSDVLIPASAGLAPAAMLPRDTLRAMDEKNLDLSAQYPKSFAQLSRVEFDRIINMSGYPLPGVGEGSTEEWDIPDPIGMEYEEHCKVRDDIESRVMNLILQLRREEKQRFKST
jgi:arsenate reductase (thioredoxin)